MKDAKNPFTQMGQDKTRFNNQGTKHQSLTWPVFLTGFAGLRGLSSAYARASARRDGGISADYADF